MDLEVVQKVSEYYLHPYYRNPYPQVNTDYFKQSLQAYHTLFDQAKTIVNHLLSHPEKMRNLMSSAQENEQDEVDRIIKSTGVPSDVKTTYTPNSVTFTLYADADNFENCCTLTMNLVWGFY